MYDENAAPDSTFAARLNEARDQIERLKALVESSFFEGFRCGEEGPLEVDECWLGSETMRKLENPFSGDARAKRGR